MKFAFKLFILALVSGFVAGESSAQNYKIKQRTTMGGQAFESTIFVKGLRKRSESGGIMGMGADVADIEQCDLKQNVKLNDKKRLYLIEPFDDSEPVAATARPTPPKASQPVTKGGTITMISNVTDTGERKQMNGFAARRVKTSMTMQSSADACTPQNMKIETDGWYIDLPAFVCPVNIRRQIPEIEKPTRSGCVDKYVVRSTGGSRTGFALSESSIFTQGGNQTFTQTTETIEISKETIDQALFEVPAGYSAVKESSALYGQPDIAAMMKAAQDEENRSSGNSTRSTPTPVPTMPAATGAKRPGMIRIGVLPTTNRSGEDVSASSMQMFLVSRLTSGNVEAVAIGSDAEASGKECDYVLSSDLTKMKQSTASKIGGLFGKVTNTDTSGSRTYEAQVDFVLIKTADGKTAVKNKASKKFDGSSDKAAESVLDLAANTILNAAK